MTQDEFLEKMASAAHDCWADWQRYVHSKVVVGGGEQSNLIYPRDYHGWWERQINLPYDELREDEKQSDRDVILKYYMPIIDQFFHEYALGISDSPPAPLSLVDCELCGGSGSIPPAKCPECNGDGKVMTTL